MGRTFRSTDLRLRNARSTFDRSFAGAHGPGGVELLRLDVGPDDVDAVEGFLGSDLLVVPPEGEGLIGDGGDEVPGHLAAMDHSPDAQADLGRPAQGAVLAAGRRRDGGQVLLGGGQQFLPLAAPPGGEQGVAAHDEPFAGEIVAGDFGQVPLVEQGRLHGAGPEQLADHR